MVNESGIYPCGDRVLVLPDPIEEQLEGSKLYIPETIRDKHALAQVIGRVVAVGPDAWTHFTERDPDGVTVRGYVRPFAESGDKVMFARYGGLPVRGKDGKEYRVINDTDITARVDEKLKATDIQSREMFK